jgi:hypothetical protein
MHAPSCNSGRLSRQCVLRTAFVAYRHAIGAGWQETLPAYHAVCLDASRNVAKPVLGIARVLADVQAKEPVARTEGGDGLHEYSKVSAQTSAHTAGDATTLACSLGGGGLIAVLTQPQLSNPLVQCGPCCRGSSRFVRSTACRRHRLQPHLQAIKVD